MGKTPASANRNEISSPNNTIQTPPSTAIKKSLLEIQQEEVDFHDKSVSAGKWYLSEPSSLQDRKKKKDRSESLGAIQQEQERMSKVIEEQFAIEAEIYNQIQLKNKLDIEKKKEQQNGKERKNRNKSCSKKKNPKDRDTKRRQRHSNRKSSGVNRVNTKASNA